MAPCLRPFLSVAQTTLVHPDTNARYPFDGLFTTVDLPKGAFLGFYSGSFRDGEYRGRDAYVFSLSTVHVRPRKSRGRVDPTRYPLAMCNEPAAGTDANVSAVEFSKARDVIPRLPPNTDIAAVAFYTCRAVKAGAELFVHYGGAYDRRHYVGYDPVADPATLVGRPCKVLKREREMPADMMRRFGLHYVDPECYAIME